MAERERRGITARIDRTNHVPVPISVTTPAGNQEERKSLVDLCGHRAMFDRVSVIK